MHRPASVCLFLFNAVYTVHIYNGIEDFPHLSTFKGVNE